MVYHSMMMDLVVDVAVLVGCLLVHACMVMDGGRAMRCWYAMLFVGFWILQICYERGRNQQSVRQIILFMTQTDTPTHT